jgi:predicted protein tyrosine phosphatase
MDMLEYMNEQEELEVIEYDELETEASLALHCLCGISSGAGA